MPQAFQVRQLLASLTTRHKNDRRTNAIVKALYYTGARIAELSSLDWDAVDLEEGTIRVLGKGNKQRLIPMPSELRTALEALEADHPRIGPVFVRFRASGERMTPECIGLAVKHAYRRAKLDHFDYTAHSLRHTYATRLAQQGFELNVIQKLLGHTNISTTSGYTHSIIDSETREAINQL